MFKSVAQPECTPKGAKLARPRVRDLIAYGELQHAFNVAALMFTLTRTRSLRLF